MASYRALAASADDDVLLREYHAQVERNVMVPMRDGIHLATDIYAPIGAGAGLLPTILVRTPYDRREVDSPDIKKRWLEFVSHGYAVVVQSMRGRYQSEGRFKPGRNVRSDADDTVSWIVQQRWSNGKIGSYGCSYPGDNQLALAATRNPHLLAAIPMAATTGLYTRGRPWEAFDGGVFELSETAGWFARYGSEIVYGPPAGVERRAWFNSRAAALFEQVPERYPPGYFAHLADLPVVDIMDNAGAPPTDYRTFVTHSPDSEYWYGLDWVTAKDRFSTPMLIMDSWYDYGVAEALQLWSLVRSNATPSSVADDVFLVIAPTTHCVYQNAQAHDHWMAGTRDLGEAGLDFVDLQQRWFDRFIKSEDNGVTHMPRVQYFLMGKNVWRGTNDWPVPGTSFRRMYLHSAGHANSRLGDGTLSWQAAGSEPRDEFTYDPANPVPTLGGQACCTGTETGAGAFDQRSVENRHDVLVYTSEPLEAGIEVTGPIRVLLCVASSVKDTDFMVKLVDVYPDGRAFNVQEGALRMRYRSGLDRQESMEPEKIYPVEIDLHATANWFGPGHRVQLDVTSSDFPRFERNLNTGGKNWDEKNWIVARSTVIHDARHPSYVTLPVVAEK
ncbi:MAG TPA: CocE/NonD family hydrolase [Steroidobacteraceae bacterium]|nr:CocE/NonD family hydrolase [Steroidobacteraceae bacterium]